MWYNCNIISLCRGGKIKSLLLILKFVLESTPKWSIMFEKRNDSLVMRTLVSHQIILTCQIPLTYIFVNRKWNYYKKYSPLKKKEKKKKKKKSLFNKTNMEECLLLNTKPFTVHSKTNQYPQFLSTVDSTD